MSQHEKFILSNISELIKDAIVACSTTKDLMQSYPMSEYVIQTLFLKMTGYNEQKLKCILWELATDDYEFRYKFLKGDYGECSNYDSKQKILQSLIAQIAKSDSSISLNCVDIFNEVKDEFDKNFSSSVFRIWFPKEYEFCFSYIDNFDTTKLKNYSCVNESKNELLITDNNDYALNLKDIFKSVIDHRNRCAHNLVSYQENLPTLKKLQDPRFVYENWFIRFFLLMYVDSLFVKLFKQYTVKRQFS